MNPRASHICKAIHVEKQWLRRGMKWIVGDGQTIQVWEDHWIPGGLLRSRIEGPLMPNEEQRLVSSLQEQHNWQLEDLQFPISKQLEQHIQGIPVVQLTRLSDSFVWPQNNGFCSVKSALNLLYQQANIPFEKSLWSWIWKLHYPKKSKFSFGSPCPIGYQRVIIWLFLAWKSITTVLGAVLRKLLSISYEIACGLRWSGVNLWVSCPYLFFQLPLQIWLQTNTKSDTLILHHQLPWKMYFTFLCWHLWLARNERIFNNQSHSQ